MSITEHDARLGNKARTSGADLCYCGSKYWERDRCIDCGGDEAVGDES